MVTAGISALLGKMYHSYVQLYCSLGDETFMFNDTFLGSEKVVVLSW